MRISLIPRLATPGLLILLGLLGSGGCADNTAAPNGGVVKEDLQAAKDREKLILEQYKNQPVNKPAASR